MRVRFFKTIEMLQRNGEVETRPAVETQLRQRRVPGGINFPTRRIPEARGIGLGRGDPTYDPTLRLTPH